jgi:hypothetical protein
VRAVLYKLSNHAAELLSINRSDVAFTSSAESPFIVHWDEFERKSGNSVSLKLMTTVTTYQIIHKVFKFLALTSPSTYSLYIYFLQHSMYIHTRKGSAEIWKAIL